MGVYKIMTVKGFKLRETFGLQSLKYKNGFVNLRV